MSHDFSSYHDIDLETAEVTQGSRDLEAPRTLHGSTEENSAQSLLQQLTSRSRSLDESFLKEFDRPLSIAGAQLPEILRDILPTVFELHNEKLNEIVQKHIPTYIANLNIATTSESWSFADLMAVTAILWIPDERYSLEKTLYGEKQPLISEQADLLVKYINSYITLGDKISAIQVVLKTSLMASPALFAKVCKTYRYNTEIMGEIRCRRKKSPQSKRY